VLFAISINFFSAVEFQYSAKIQFEENARQVTAAPGHFTFSADYYLCS